MNGWIKKHRRIMSHWLYLEDRIFSKYEAFDFLLMSVNHQDKKVMFDNKLLVVERGSLITSIRKLCDSWRWSNKKVVRFLNDLESDGIISKKSDTKKTVINIVNYCKYQGSDNEESDSKATAKRQQSDTEASAKHTNKNVNKGKKDNKDLKDIVEHLNFSAGKNYKAESNLTSRLISARLNEGFTVDDFKRVIDAKVSEWGHDEKMQKFLRPETLFGTKFESYLNSNITPIKKKLSDRDQALQDWMNAGGDPDEFQYYRS
jgi:uncharacterized phage protein (TIGR02220 family)